MEPESLEMLRQAELRYWEAQAALTESEARFHAFISKSAYGYAVLDLAGMVLFVNPRLAEIVGYPPQEMVGHHYTEYVPGGDPEQSRAAFEKALAQQSVDASQVCTVRTKGGEIKFLAMTALALHYEKEPSRLLCLFLDITHYRKVESALGEREQRYRELLAAVTNYTYSVKLENGVPVATDHSWGCLAITGYFPDDYKSDPYLWIAMVHPDDRDMVRQYVAAVLGGEKVPAIEHRIIRRDGAVRWLRDTIVPHHDGSRLVRYDGLVEDVTDRRRAELALREREMQLLLAQKIQEHLLPEAPPLLPGFDIGGGSYPAEFTAGDFFDYLTMPNGSVGFVISDVSGHGFGPALLMASTSTLIRLLAETQTDVGDILARVNRFLARETDDHFVTLFLGCLDPNSRSFHYASAGNPTGYVLDASGVVKARLRSTAPLLAISPAMEFPAAAPILLQPGDIVVLLTDGIQEALSPQREPFGTDRLLEVVRAQRTRKAAEIVESLYRAVCEFSRHEKPADDVTMIVIKVQA